MLGSNLRISEYSIEYVFNIVKWYNVLKFILHHRPIHGVLA